MDCHMPTCEHTFTCCRINTYLKRHRAVKCGEVIGPTSSLNIQPVLL